MTEPTDFATRDDYDQFLRQLLQRRNNLRREQRRTLFFTLAKLVLCRRVGQYFNRHICRLLETLS